jgi:hypothetical protein
VRSPSLAELRRDRSSNGLSIIPSFLRDPHGSEARGRPIGSDGGGVVFPDDAFHSESGGDAFHKATAREPSSGVIAELHDVIHAGDALGCSADEVEPKAVSDGING